MSLPLIMSNLKPIKWSEVKMSNINPKQSRIKMDDVKNKSAKDVSQQDHYPEAELHFPVNMQDLSLDVKTSEYATFTISIDDNNAAKVDTDLEITKIKTKRKVKEGLVGAVMMGESTHIVYTNPLIALQQVPDPSKIQLVTFDLYEDSTWNSSPLSCFRQDLLTESTDDKINHLVVQYHELSDKTLSGKVLSKLRKHLKCPELSLDNFNPNVTSGKMWFTCPNGTIPDKLSPDAIDSLQKELNRIIKVSDVYVVNRSPISSDE